jgi:hypothetical protein
MSVRELKDASRTSAEADSRCMTYINTIDISA